MVKFMEENRIKIVIKSNLIRLSVEKGYNINKDNIHNITLMIHEKLKSNYESAMELLVDNFENRIQGLLSETNRVMYELVDILTPQQYKNYSKVYSSKAREYDRLCKDYKYVCMSRILVKTLTSSSEYYRGKLTDLLINSCNYHSEEQVDGFIKNKAVGFDNKDCCVDLAKELLNKEDFVVYYCDGEYNGCYMNIN